MILNQPHITRCLSKQTLREFLRQMDSTLVVKDGVRYIMYGVFS